MDTLFELAESHVFRVAPSGAIAPVSRAATRLREELPSASLEELFGAASHAALAHLAASGEPRVVNLSRPRGPAKIRWEVLAPAGPAAELLLVGVDWRPASEVVDRMARETLIFKEAVMNIVPRFIVEAMLERKAVEPKAYREATIMFVRATRFSEHSLSVDPVTLLKRVDAHFSAFDRSCMAHGLEKLKTLAETYVAVSGIPRRRPLHAVDAVLAGLEMLRGIAARRAMDHREDPAWDFRIGVHSGPCISGVLGANKYVFDVWGDTVTRASEVEEAGGPGVVTVSAATAALVRDWFELAPAGDVGAGSDLFTVHRLKPELSADAEGTIPNATFRSSYQRYVVEHWPRGASAPPPKFDP